MPAVWSACLLRGLLCWLLLRVLCGLVPWSHAVVFALLFQQFEMGFWVCGSGGGSSRARYFLRVRRAKRGTPIHGSGDVGLYLTKGVGIWQISIMVGQFNYTGEACKKL